MTLTAEAPVVGCSGRRRARLEDLYPPAAWDLPVAPALPAPHLAAAPVEQVCRSGFREHYGRFVLAEFPLPGGERIAAVDKAFPHALFDLMLLVARDEGICRHVGHAPEPVLEFLLDAARRFRAFTLEHAERFALLGAPIAVGWNYDPTSDRDNGQWWDKRLHVHFNAWPRPVADAARAVALREIASETARRSLIDPVAFLGEHVLHDVLDGAPLPPGARVLPGDVGRDRALGLATGWKLALPDWETVAAPAMRVLLAQIHARAREAYDAIRRAMTGSTDLPGPWRRPALLAPEQVAESLDALPWLSPGARAGLLTLRDALREVTARQMALLRDRPGLANRFLSLEDLSYNISITPVPGNPGTPCLTVQVKLISYIGSSPALGGAVASIIDRAGGPVLTAADAGTRRDFQQAFLAELAGGGR